MTSFCRVGKYRVGKITSFRSPGKYRVAFRSVFWGLTVFRVDSGDFSRERDCFDARAAELHDMVMAVPDGYNNSQVGEGAGGCLVASGSASPLHGRCCAIPACWCSTKPLPPQS